MSTMTLAAADSATMLRRNLRRVIRYPALTVFIAGGPVIFLLLFVYVFGGTLGNGIGGAGGGRAAYANYVVPGLLVLTAAGAVQTAALGVAADMAEGIVARFKTMAIARSAVLTGHVVSSVIQTLAAMVIVLALALAVGFRPDAGAVEWLAAAGFTVAVAFALTWLAVALGLAAPNVESATNWPSILLLLPFLGSGFVPTDSMPAGLRAFADHQPFTSFIETLRGLLTGTRIGGSGWVSLAWCAGIALAGYLWAKRLYARDPAS